MKVTLSRGMAAAQRRKAEIAQSLSQRRVNKSKNTSESSSDLLTEEYDELKRNYRSMQEENLKLQAIITDVTQVNKRWQRYNNDRQVYVDKLLTTIKEQQEQMNKISEDSAVNLNKQNSAGSEIENLRQKNLELREEVHHLRKELDEKEREGAALRVQAQVHRDDWEAERAEKIAALQQREQAEKRVEELKMDLRNLSHKLREERLRSPFQCPSCGHCIPLEDTAIAPKPVEPCKRRGSLIARGCYMTSDDDMYLTCDEVASRNPSSALVKDSNTEDSGSSKKSCETTETLKNNFPEDSPCTSFSVVSGEGAVTLGFSSSGLASVTSFPVHAYSPTAASGASRKSTPYRSGSPPSVQRHSRRSSQSCTPVSTQEDEDEDGGIATQTRMDIICPGCSAVFPPGHHIDFLDHFELCQQQKPPISEELEEPKTVLKCPKCSRTFPSCQQINFLDHFDQCKWPERRFVEQDTANNGCMSR
ncbi:uncharacterized protein LOC126091980 [Schistocerca cancellata]|uniref:uncharacterized protein LOC126091980 n=1 Tax=Schistocerca cancellata TaxID=274614 RepID=UPI002117C533|nr:uncharacterized protein LOC126091980 [Schistocerca cancellata]